MPRPATGTLDTRPRKDGLITYAARVPYKGRQVRVTFGTSAEGWNEQRARNELERIIDRVRRGTWQPPVRSTRETPAKHPADASEEFRAFLYRWWQGKKLELTPRGIEDYRWRIGHLLAGDLPNMPVAALDRQAVDTERQRLLEHGLAPRSTNMVLMLLAQVLDDAVDYGLLDANPARGRKRRVKEQPVKRSWLEPEQALALIEAAGELEAEARPSDRYGRRAIVATLVLAGPRVSELVLVPRAGLDLHGARLRLGMKTEAGTDRDIDLTWFLLGELRGWVAARDLDPAGPLFPTRTGRPHDVSNVRRLLRQCAERSRQDSWTGTSIPSSPTPHSCRRTYATLCFLAGRDPRYVMGQLGHADPRMTLSVYAQTINRRNVDKALVMRLMAFPDEQETHGRAEPAPEGIDARGVLGTEPRLRRASTGDR